MKKSEWQPAYDTIRLFVEDAARTHYGGNKERGFKFWAISEVLMETDLSDDQLKEPLVLDGRGDLGLDGYYEDPDAQTLILVQSKFHEQPVAIGNDELNRFLSSLKKVLDPQVVVATSNPLAQDAHRAVRDAIQRHWTLRFVFVSSGYLSPEGRTFAEANVQDTETIDSTEVRKEFEVYDLEKLKALYESHLSPSRFNTDVELAIAAKDRIESTVSGFRVLLANMAAAELVRAFRQHQYALFRLNPRGPLQNKVNSRILGTLRDEHKRDLFFHLNNGITAVCDSFKADDGQVIIRDFQIVNGCQTTVTLVRAAPIVEADQGIRILVRLIEGLAGLRDDIARATNDQARLTAQDFKSNDPLQRDLKNQFDALPSPVFYEVKRGDWVMVSDRQRYWDEGLSQYRRMKMKDLAQAAFALLGEPGDAKDKSRTIFEDESRYKKVFPEGVRAQQLLLPWHVYRAADKACETWTKFSGAQYARYCLVALVGSELAANQELLPLHESAKVLAQPDHIDALIKRGQQAVGSLVAALGDEYPGHREFFRSDDFFSKVLKSFRAQPS